LLLLLLLCHPHILPRINDLCRICPPPAGPPLPRAARILPVER
jgi:hypothetical protein